jgi:archaellum biogenesis ATPase FlaH
MFNLFKKRKGKAKSKKELVQPFSIIKTEEGSYDDFYDKILRYSLIMLITGKRGSGKTSLGMSLLEVFNSIDKKCYAVGFGKAKVPRWLHKADSLENVPNNSAVLVDEGAIVYSARDSMKNANKMLGKLMAIARHKNLSLILIAQNSAMLDVNILRLSDILLLKEPSLLQTEFERKALQKLYSKIKPLFKEQDRRERCFYVWSDEFQGLLAHDLPVFWNSSISKAFSTFK